MTDKPALSWYPTTIEELQRLLDSGVWPRVRAIADDVGPLQIAQGRLTYIDRKDGMSGILREGPAPAGAEPFDLTSRSLWLWRAEATEPAKREHTMVLRLDKPPRFEQSASIEKALGLLPLIEEALAKLERRIDGVRSWPEHVRWLDIAGPIRSWCAEVRCSGTLERRIDGVRSWPEHVRWLDIAGPIRSWCAEVRCSGTLDLPLVVAVCDAVGKLALDVDKLDHVRVASAAGSLARILGEKVDLSPAARATESLRSLLTTAASMMARFPGPTPEEIKEPEFDMPPSVAGVDFCVVELDGGGWRMEASCDDPGGPLGPECVVRGEERDSKAEAVVDAWGFAFGLRTGQMDRAISISRAAASRVKLNLNDRAHFVLTDFGAAQWAEWEKGTTERFAGLFERSECTVSASSSSAAAGQYSCKLWELAQALGSSMYIGAQRVIEDNAIEVEVQPSDVEKASPGKMERERDAEAEIERLADYLLRHHASECAWPGSGERAVDVVIRLLKRAGDFESRRLDLARCSDALRRIAAASNLMVLGMRGPEFAMELAERVEQQFTDFRKVADQLGTDREIAGAAEQLVRRLVDRLVETDPEYIEQLRRSGS